MGHKAGSRLPALQIQWITSENPRLEWPIKQVSLVLFSTVQFSFNIFCALPLCIIRSELSLILYMTHPTSFPGTFVFPQEGVVEEKPFPPVGRRKTLGTRLVTHLGAEHTLTLSRPHFFPQLFKDPECWSGRSRTHDLPRHSPMLNNWATGARWPTKRSLKQSSGEGKGNILLV